MTDLFDEGEPLSPGNPAGFMAYHFDIGSSASEALNAWREVGGTTGDAQWYRLWGQVADTILRTDSFLSLDPGAIPMPSDLGTWEAGTGGQYATQVTVVARDDETGLLVSNQFTYMSDSPHSKEEAEEAAMDAYGSDDAEDRYGQSVLGAFATHGWQTVPFGG